MASSDKLTDAKDVVPMKDPEPQNFELVIVNGAPVLRVKVRLDPRTAPAMEQAIHAIRQFNESWRENPLESAKRAQRIFVMLQNINLDEAALYLASNPESNAQHRLFSSIMHSVSELVEKAKLNSQKSV